MSYLKVALEESPVNEANVGSIVTPYRISTDAFYLPIQNSAPDPGINWIDRSDELRNIEGDIPDLIESFAPAGSLAERAYFNSLTPLLACCGLTPVHTAGGAGVLDPDGNTIPATAHRWQFTPRAGRTPQTLEAIWAYAEESTFLKENGVAPSQLSLNAAGDVSASLMGLVFKRIADPSLTPSYDTATIPPARRADMLINWVGGGGEIDDFSVAVASALEGRHTFGATARSYYPDKMYQGDQRLQITGSVPKYVFNAADIDALLAAATFSATAKWVSDVNILATSFPYKLFIEMPACLLKTGAPADLANTRRHGANFDFKAHYSQGSGFSCRITLVNSVASIATYV